MIASTGEFSRVIAAKGRSCQRLRWKGAEAGQAEGKPKRQYISQAMLNNEAQALSSERSVTAQIHRPPSSLRVAA